MEALVPERRWRPRYSQRIRAAAIHTLEAADQNFSIRRCGLANSETSTEACASSATPGGGAASELALESICVVAVAPLSTCPVNRYPRRGMVSMKRAVSAESFKASRNRLIALFKP